jgi:ribosomal protein S18 acetylase RimI-like enzyme
MNAYQIAVADLRLPAQQRAVVELIDAYSRDPMGNGRPLPPEVRERLVEGLRRHPTTLVLLAWDGTKPVGIAVCFLGFSTFAARPLVNVHDLAVLPEHRGRGVARRLLAAVESEARQRRCCKVTLEVLEHNEPARHLYASLGFAEVRYRPESGPALFLAKPL